MIRVLIVDDDKLARLGLRSMIPWERYGMEVAGEAANGKDALELLRTSPVDLVFVDISMPVLNGIEMIKQAQQEFENIDYVVLSFHEEFEYVRYALQLGVLDYISKDKTETENYDEIMLRICKRLSAAKEEQEQTAENLKRLEELLDGVLWLYDNLLASEIAALLKNWSGGTRALERALAAACARVSSDTGLIDCRVPMLKDGTAALLYLEEYRKEFILASERETENIYARLMTAARFVWENGKRQIQAVDVANAINFSRSYFSVSFKKILGITFNTFLRRERIFHAQRLLKSTTLPQLEIAYQIGYEDLRNFKNVFCEITGMTTTQYRKLFLTTQKNK